MYTAFWSGRLPQALLLPNWVAGFAVMIRLWGAVRLPQEEQLMLKSFGDDYGNTWSKPIGWCPEFAKRAVPAGYIRLNLGN